MTRLIDEWRGEREGEEGERRTRKKKKKRKEKIINFMKYQFRLYYYHCVRFCTCLFLEESIRTVTLKTLHAYRKSCGIMIFKNKV